MKDSIDFGKVQTYEELKMLRELEKHYKKHPVKHKRKYSKDTSKIKLKGGGWYGVKKSEEKGPFFELTKRQRKAVVMLYEGAYTNKEIAETLHCSESLIYKWKRENKLFQQARRQYETMIIEDKYVSEAMQSIYALVKTAKSEMVRLQAAISILKLAGRLTDSSTPELDKAKVRKANAEADIARWRADELTGKNKADDSTVLVDDIGDAEDE